MKQNRQIGSGKDGPRTGGKFRCDLIEVELPFVNYGVRFSPTGRAGRRLPNREMTKTHAGSPGRKASRWLRKKIDEIPSGSELGGLVAERLMGGKMCNVTMAVTGVRDRQGIA